MPTALFIRRRCRGCDRPLTRRPQLFAFGRSCVNCGAVAPAHTWLGLALLVALFALAIVGTAELLYLYLS